MSEHSELLESIADTIADYREDAIEKPTPDHVERWINQFGENVRLPILQEMNHVLKKTYFSKASVLEFLRAVLNRAELVGSDPRTFWQNVNFLNIQHGGNSQAEALQLLDELLREEFGYGVEIRNKESDIFIYLDDGVFTGNRVKHDISHWIAESAPDTVHLHIVTIILHTNGRYYAEKGIKECVASSNKKIKLFWHQAIAFENRIANKDTSDVLWPVSLPDDAATLEYASDLQYPLTFRNAGQVGARQIFSSDTARQLIENEFLKFGIGIRKNSPLLNEYQRPLGNMVLSGLGFGSLVVTYRNCPNNAPLALWAGDPWYPLFDRITN